LHIGVIPRPSQFEDRRRRLASAMVLLWISRIADGGSGVGSVASNRTETCLRKMDRTAIRLGVCSAAALGAVLVTAAVALGPVAAQAPSGPRQAAAQQQPQGKAEKSSPAAKGAQAIVVLVNDEPVTAYEVEQRANFLAANAPGDPDLRARAEARWAQIAKDPKNNERLQKLFQEKGVTSREQAVAIQQEFAKNLQRDMLEQLKREVRAGKAAQFKKQSLEELIEERLKLQEAKRVGVEVPETDLDRVMKGLAERNNMTEPQFIQHLKSSNIDPQTMRERFKTNYAWREVIRRKYGPQIAITQRDVDRVIADTATETGTDTVELQLQKITLPMPSHVDQTALAKRFTEAEGLRRKFTNCQATAGLAKEIPDARFEDLKTAKPSSIPEPTRSMLLGAKDGDILPPATAATGIEVYAVCGRRVIKGDDKQREKAMEDLQAKEYEIVARRHLRDLRQDAHIEYR
jgi:peptidyl-prolyl cis-trans isomerase SurA